MPEEFNLPKSEEKILEFWKTNQIFEKTLKSREGKEEFIFYEGPPYANGKPGIHHVLARIYKDVILRYKTMRGYHVPRRAGWDTHGLPVEIAAEKALGLKSKKDIEKFGIKKFNEEAKKAVWLYKDEWERLTERIGYWLDLKNAYVTYEPEYIETLWWTLAQIAKKKLLYKGHKVVPWCTRCGTALSSHELALGYKEVEDNSVYVKFKLKKGQKIGKNFTTDDKTYILSWTTTPWTLPGNVALAIGKNITYVSVRHNDEYYILAKDRLPSVIASGSEAIRDEIVASSSHGGTSRNDTILKEFAGKDLVGFEYEPLFDVKPLHSKSSYKIYDADFVTTEDGTGVVHTAVMYGEDDYKLGQKVGLPQYHTVDEEGKFIKDVPGLSGLYVKAPGTEKKILDYLEAKSLKLKAEKYVHEYPYCWRCGAPVLYYARNSWFIEMSKLRDNLLDANKNINWVPDHLKNGRFGEWLKEVKDWNLSRERYWGTPLPIWECENCGNFDVVGGFGDLSKKAGGSRNKYWTMRHGEAENNVKGIVDSGQGKFGLTAKGKNQVARSVGELKKKLDGGKKKIDIVIASDIQRTKETAELAASLLGVKRMEFDPRIREILLGELSGCHDGKYHKLFPTYEDKFNGGPKGGEALRDMRKRVWEFLDDCEKKYKGKNILLVSHEYTIWMLNHVARGWSEKQAIAEKEGRGKDFVETAETDELDFMIIPRDGTGLVDPHKPFVDEITLPCGKCKKTMRRAKEVVDVWYDSGAMPFASERFPFAQSAKRKAQGANNKDDLRLALSDLPFPADYIAEGMDQTRGWFYTLLAVATALGHGAPYKNVVSLGLINDKHGQKMSKSKGNTVEPWEVINKYGADAVRWYFYTVNPPGETKNFDEAEIQKAYRKMHLLLWNSLVFLETYAGGKVTVDELSLRVWMGERQETSKNVLDRWMVARLDDAEEKVAKGLDSYNIRDAALEIESLVNDLSRWYIRRSRRRLQKPESSEDYEGAASTMGFVILETVKLVAPFTPFFSELLRERLRGFAPISRELITKNGNDRTLSVHLEEWPVSSGKNRQKTDDNLLKAMDDVRRLASIALAKRAEAGIKIRQPLRELRIRNKELWKNKELLAVLADEVNVKNIVFDSKLNLAERDEVELDTVITPELKEEGMLREFARAVQELRQKAGFKPGDVIVVMLELPEMLSGIVLRNEELLKKEVGAKAIEYKKGKSDATAETEIDGWKVRLSVRRI